MGAFGTEGLTSGRVDEGAVVEIVSVEVAEVAPGVTLGGENEQEASVGNPAEHASDTWPVNATPACGARVIV